MIIKKKHTIRAKVRRMRTASDLQAVSLVLTAIKGAIKQQIVGSQRGLYKASLNPLLFLL
jgi:imidazolonepropionase-like amidohydrolase